MTAIRAIAGQVLGDALRERVFHVAGLHLLALLVLVPFVGAVTLGAPTRGVQDLGLTTCWLAASAVAIWLGVRFVGADLSSRAAALLWVRPIPRGAWLLGRGLGIAATLAIEVALLVGGFVVVAGGRAPSLADVGVFALLLWAEGCVVAAIAALLGTRLAPLFAAACATGLWAAGHLAEEYVRVVGPGIAAAVFTVVPDLDLFVVHTEIVQGAPLDPARVAAALGYAALWVTGLSAVTAVVVGRTDGA